jgi:hypothetical protein
MNKNGSMLLESFTLSRSMLVIFDLNGTLISKVKRQKAKAIELKHQFMVNDYKVYVRKDAVKVLNQLFQLGVSIAVWTSAQNGHEITRRLLGSNFDKLEFIWTRSDCLEVNGVHSKPLHLVFEKNDKWNAQNTFIVDDSPLKAAANPENLYHIRKFNPHDLTTDWKADTEMRKLLLWVQSRI